MSFSLLVKALWMQAKIQFAFVSAVLHCWIMFSLLMSTRAHRSLLPQLFPSHTDPNPYWLPTFPVYPGLSLRWLSLSDMFSSAGGDFGVVSKLGEDTFTKKHRIWKVARNYWRSSNPASLLKQGPKSKLLNLLSRCFLNISEKDDYITSPGNQFKGSVTCTVKLFFLFRWNFLCLNFCLLPLICCQLHR